LELDVEVEEADKEDEDAEEEEPVVVVPEEVDEVERLDVVRGDEVVGVVEPFGARATYPPTIAAIITITAIPTATALLMPLMGLDILATDVGVIDKNVVLFFSTLLTF